MKTNAKQMGVILYHSGLTADQIHEKRAYLNETYFKGAELRAWWDIITNLV